MPVSVPNSLSLPEPILPTPLSGAVNDADLLYQIALHGIFYAYPSHLLQLLKHWGSGEAVFKENNKRRFSELGIAERLTNELYSNRKSHLMAARQALKWLEQKDHNLLGLGDPQYPALLKEIADPPVYLFLDGNHQALQEIKFSIVGSRHPTRSGSQTARELAGKLAIQGFAIVSGMAKGIDSAAHRGALSVDKTTLAVLGTGCDLVYPPGQKELAGLIKERGLLLSEYPLGTPPLKQNFPRRNRIVTGCSLGTLVVEGAERSGSLISARLAMEQGREVFAVPGSIYSRQSSACHALIRQGAKLTESITDILEELQGLMQFELDERELPKKEGENLSETEKILIAAMDLDPIQVDELFVKTRIPVNQIASLLTSLEVKGIVQSDLTGYCLAPVKRL